MEFAKKTMSLFKIEFHDGKTFHNLINIICKITGDCRLFLRQDELKIEAINNHKTVVMKVVFDIDYVKHYYLNPEYESHTIYFKSSSLEMKGSMKKNDVLVFKQDIGNPLINVNLIFNNRDEGSCAFSFINGDSKSEDTFSFDSDEKEFSRCKMKVDSLSAIFKNSAAKHVKKVFFMFFEEGLRIDMRDSHGKLTWTSGEDYSGNYTSVEVNSQIIAELTRINTIQFESMCLITSYEDGGMLKMKFPIGCYATAELYLIESLNEPVPEKVIE